jgi:hypothetical protein
MVKSMVLFLMARSSVSRIHAEDRIELWICPIIQEKAYSGVRRPERKRTIRSSVILGKMSHETMYEPLRITI